MKIVITGGVASAAENPSLNSKRTVFPKVPIQAYLRARRVFSKFQVHARCKKASGKGLVQQFCELAWDERRAISARSSRPPPRTPERRKSPAQSPVRLAVFAAEIWTSDSSFGVGIAARFLGPRRLQNGAHQIPAGLAAIKNVQPPRRVRRGTMTAARMAPAL
jgi:hypothetical protein